MLCGQCLLLGFCRRLQSYKVTEREIDARQFVMDLKRHARDLAIPSDSWAEYLIGRYRDYPGIIVDAAGREIELDTEVFALPSIKYWFREFIGKEPLPLMATHVRREARERVIVMASILRAWEPVKANLWGKEIANDHRPLPVPANSNRREYCPNWRLLVE